MNFRDVIWEPNVFGPRNLARAAESSKPTEPTQKRDKIPYACAYELVGEVIKVTPVEEISLQRRELPA